MSERGGSQDSDAAGTHPSTGDGSGTDDGSAARKSKPVRKSKKAGVKAGATRAKQATEKVGEVVENTVAGTKEAMIGAFDKAINSIDEAMNRKH